MSEPKDVIYEQLLKKISSKYQINAIFIGFTATMLAIVMSSVTGKSGILFSTLLSMLSIFEAVYLFIFGLLSFDRLTMPKAFWSKMALSKFLSDERFRRITDGDLEGLKEVMLLFWKAFTIPALILIIVAIVLFVSHPLTKFLALEKDIKIIPQLLLLASLFSLLYFYLINRIVKSKYPDLMRHTD